MKSCSVLVALALLTAAPARGQGVSPADPREAARFEAVVRAATRAGYAQPMVVAHGVGDADSLFALLATRGDSGVLIVLREPAGPASAQPVELEHDRTPAQFGIRGIQFNVFLGRAGLTDVVVNHEPLTLEMSRQFETHHVLRRSGATIEPACQFPGSSTTSSSKGIGSVTGTRRVTVSQVSSGGPLRFRVTTVDETTEQSGRQAATTTAHTETTRQFELPAAGACRELPH